MSLVRLPALLALAAVLASCAQPAATARRDDSDSVLGAPAPDFVLTDQHGRPFRLSAQHGRGLILFFGYTHCRDICPTTMAHLAALVHRLPPAQRDALRVVLVTVDPARDTPRRMGSYVMAFDPSFVGLTGGRGALEPVYRTYGVQAEPAEQDARARQIDHSSALYFIDSLGRLAAVRDWNLAPARLTAQTEQLFFPQKDSALH